MDVEHRLPRSDRPRNLRTRASSSERASREVYQRDCLDADGGMVDKMMISLGLLEVMSEGGDFCAASSFHGCYA